jgi:hypothetical protein
VSTAMTDWPERFFALQREHHEQLARLHRVYAERRELLHRERSEWTLAQIKAGRSIASLAADQKVTAEAVRQWLRAYPDLYDDWFLWKEQERERIASERAASLAQRQIKTRSRYKLQPRRWSDDELIAFVREAAEELGQPLSSLAMKEWLHARSDTPSYRGLAIRLGRSWAEVCARCGVVPVGGRGPGVTREQCEVAVMRVAEFLGRPPTHDEYERLKNQGDPGASTVRERLGDGLWSGAVAYVSSALNGKDSEVVS